MRISLTHSIYALMLFCCLLQPNDIVAQNKDDVKSDAKREEIQRYVGYETLLYRYLSLPYDVTMNNNERGTGFLDIGFILLMFLPILVMLRFRHRWSVLLVTAALMLIMFIVSTSNSFLFNQQIKSGIEITKDGIRQPASPSESPGQNFVINNGTSLNDRIIRTFFNINSTLYKPFGAISDKISGQKDGITYPIILLLFAGMFCFWMFVGKVSPKISAITIGSIFLLFTFYWFILSPGIVWYGFLALLLGNVMLMLLLPKQNSEDKLNQIGSYTFYGIAGIWLLIATVSRISNVQPGYPQEVLGKIMVNPVTLKYTAGEFTEKIVIDQFYRNTSKVLDQINRDSKALVFRIGTSFSYFIDNNHERVIMDNQLQLFNNFTKVYTDKREIANAMKASNIRYFMIDLNTPTLDNTPEQSLIKKYNLALNFLFQNPNVQLLATDRVIMREEDGGQQRNAMFDGEVVQNGTFAIYQIK